jgi:hypothetical protein
VLAFKKQPPARFLEGARFSISGGSPCLCSGKPVLAFKKEPPARFLEGACFSVSGGSPLLQQGEPDFQVRRNDPRPLKAALAAGLGHPRSHLARHYEYATFMFFASSRVTRCLCRYAKFAMCTATADRYPASTGAFGCFRLRTQSIQFAMWFWSRECPINPSPEGRFTFSG